MRLRRLLHLAAPLTLPIVGISAAATRSDAQAPCPVALGSVYNGQDFECSIAGWRFYEFRLDRFGNTDEDDNETLLSPFARTDKRGRQIFGFELTNFQSRGGVGPAYPDSLYESDRESMGTRDLVFYAESLDPRTYLKNSMMDYSVIGSTSTPRRVTFFSEARGSDGCLDFDAEVSLSQDPTVPRGRRNQRKAGSRKGLCGDSRPRDFQAYYTVHSYALLTGPGNRLADVSTSAEISRITFTSATLGAQQVVPEPSTVALLAGGLFALGGIAVRRRLS